MFESASCTIDTTSETRFVFSEGSTSASDIIGKSVSKNSSTDTLYTCAGAECKTIVFTYNGNTYTFTLPLSLKVGENK